MEDLDNAMDVIDSMEKRDSGASQASGSQGRVLIGTVEHFFDKIDVVAIKLTGSLRVGDVIEIGGEEEAVRQKVSSMQIDRKDVEAAHEGDSVGIKVNHRVERGSSVYKIG